MKLLYLILISLIEVTHLAVGELTMKSSYSDSDFNKSILGGPDNIGPEIQKLPSLSNEEGDRRLQRRFLAKKGSFALIGSNLKSTLRILSMSFGEIAFAVINSNCNKMGRIIDISLGGISICYLDSNIESDKGVELDILFAEERFFLNSISFNCISDFMMIERAPMNAFKMRRLGVQFNNLRPYQRSQIDKFIGSYATFIG